MMGHRATPQSVDREGAVETNISFNREALERAHLRNNPELAGDADRDRDVRIAAGCSPRGDTLDSTLNWAGGQQVATIGENDNPFSGDMARVAGTGAESPAPDPGAAYPHGANTEEIFRGRQ
jgi:hypothetical protein